MTGLYKLILIILLPLFSFSQNEENTQDSSKNLNDFVIITTDAIYEGYQRVDLNFFRPQWDFGLPSNYSYYYNIADFKNYLKREEPKYNDNLKKYRTISAESKAIYLNKYQEELNIVSNEDFKNSTISFKRIVLQTYIKVLTGETNISVDLKLPLKFYNGDFDIRYFKIDLQAWNRNLKKYDFINEVKKIRNITDVDSLVEINESLVKELELLDYYSKNKELFEKKLMSLDDYDKYILKMQNDYPGRFTNKQRLEKDRNNFIKELPKKRKIARAKTNGYFDDFDFKLHRVYILLASLSSNVRVSAYGISVSDEWYLKQPEEIILYPNHKTIPLKIEKTKLLEKNVNKQANSNDNTRTYIITVDNLRVRTSPQLDSEKIENLAIGSKVEFLEKSNNQTTVTIKNNEITEYWYKVKTSSGNIGWIHGCCFEK
ncbi:SH3 domain-containing protein [Bizionia sp. KMM 8389]